ncbi:MAG: hypothetical protein JOS17DRAFT_727480 [Linnemannia elongata]|nr:MAG: hypothetical protein JOS17DRAFT_727480 [Linnemannia elongata]
MGYGHAPSHSANLLFFFVILLIQTKARHDHRRSKGQVSILLKSYQFRHCFRTLSPTNGRGRRGTRTQIQQKNSNNAITNTPVPHHGRKAHFTLLHCPFTLPKTPRRLLDSPLHGRDRPLALSLPLSFRQRPPPRK